MSSIYFVQHVLAKTCIRNIVHHMSHLVAIKVQEQLANDVASEASCQPELPD